MANFNGGWFCVGFLWGCIFHAGLLELGEAVIKRRGRKRDKETKWEPMRSGKERQ